jgi:uncharacterized membrane protein YbaN (DUF454 family)
MLHSIRFLLWRLLAVTFLLLGLIGVLLPGLPTVPFLLLAAWAGSRGWPQLEAYLLNHPVYGASIRNWRERRAVPRRAKWTATIVMALSSLLVWFSPAPLWLQASITALLVSVAFWLWNRAEI